MPLSSESFFFHAGPVFPSTPHELSSNTIDRLGIFKCKVYYRSLSLYCPRLGFSLSVYLVPFSSIFRGGV